MKLLSSYFNTSAFLNFTKLYYRDLRSLTTTQATELSEAKRFEDLKGSRRHILIRKLKKLNLASVDNFVNKLEKHDGPSRSFFILETKKLVREALMADSIHINEIFCTEKAMRSANFEKKLTSKTQIVIVDDSFIELITNLTNSDGVLGYAQYIPDKIKPCQENNHSVDVLLDGVKDPGNMGTIIRTACGLGCQNLYLTKSCVNPWSAKVLRSSMSGHFNLKIHEKTDPRALFSQFAASKGLVVLGDSKEGKPSNDLNNLHLKTSLKSPVLVVIGNEATGIEQSIYSHLESHSLKHLIVRIPCQQRVESLNAAVAFGIIYYEINQMLNKHKQ